MVKGICLAAVVLATMCVSGCPPLVTLALDAAHVGVFALAGFLVLRAARVPLSGSPTDRLVVFYLAGWACLPLAAFAVWLTGRHLTGLGLAAALLLFLAWLGRRGERPHGAPVVELSAPPALYGAALLYVLWSVAMPFLAFSPGSQVREMYTDGFQRFGTIYALADSVPPANPFAAGLPFRYYWFALLPYAMEYRWLHPDLFAVWKSGQMVLAFAVVSGIWIVLHAVTRDHRVAWGAWLFAFCFASWELWASAPVRSAFASVSWHAPLAAARQIAEAAVRTDPDHVLGVVTPFSDQLFMEDFLYIPHNAVALGVVLVAMLLADRGRDGWAAWAVASLAGCNTFVLPAAAPALVAVVAARRGLLEALWCAVLMAGWSSAWMTVCGILPPMGGMTMAVAALALASISAAGTRRRGSAGAPSPDAGAAPALRLSAAAALGALLCLAVVRGPAHTLAAFVLNYGPSFPLGVVALAGMAVWPRCFVSPARPAILFLVLALAAYLLVDTVLLLAFADGAPAPVRALSGRLTEWVNAFNFHHKAGKLARLAWAVIAAAGCAAWLFSRRRAGWLWLGAALSVLLVAAAGTGIARPWTYRAGASNPEVAAAQYLRRHGFGMDTVVLLEDIRGSTINQLAPVSVFHISTWAGLPRDVTRDVDIWVDQFLPAGWRGESARREALQKALFGQVPDLPELRRLVARHAIRFILTRRRYDLDPVARLVVGVPGGYLYETTERRADEVQRLGPTKHPATIELAASAAGSHSDSTGPPRHPPPGRWP